MTGEILIVLAVLLAALVLFVTEKLPIDLVSLLIVATLWLTGILTAEEGLAGFSNPATITVGAMFVLSAALYKTGAVSFLGERLAKIARRSFFLALLSMVLMVGFVSAFINNTAAVAVLMPIVLGVSRDVKRSPSLLLMPLSFASMFGGLCTLIGTSTNILVSAIAVQHGQPAFSMFEFLPVGGVLFAAGTVYLLATARFIPERRPPGDLTQTFGMGDYLTEIVLLPDATSVGRPLRDSPLVKELDIDVIEIYRDKRRLPPPRPETVLEAGDLLRVRCDVEKIRKMEERAGIALKSGAKWRDQDLQSAQMALVEAVIAPNSRLEGRSLKEVGFRNVYDATALAIRHRGKTMHERLGTMPLQAGDALLIEVRRDAFQVLQRNPDFVIVSEVGLPEFRRSKIVPALAIMAGVVAAATFELLPIVVAAVVGAVLLVLTGCIRLEEVYRAIEWRVIFLLAGVLTLGIALEKTGAAALLSSALVGAIGDYGPQALLSAFFLVTLLLTGVMSNNATAVLLAPIAISAAAAVGADPRPFLVAVAFAASSSFMTPVGYQTNTLIYGPGQYKFADFLRIGGPLCLVFWLLSSLLIPVFWPL